VPPSYAASAARGVIQAQLTVSEPSATAPGPPAGADEEAGVRALGFATGVIQRAK
jgi:hypothetical protein